MNPSKRKCADVRLALLTDGGINVDAISKRGEVFTLRHGFFYRHGRSAQYFADGVKKAFPNATILDYGEYWADFNGHAPLCRSSHWFVKFILN
ncbi:MAG TPA: hypothetical protein PKI17_00250 [Syntrophomonas sp.]|nr:hypothetical protein [Syntrophomonas sp.]